MQVELAFTSGDDTFEIHTTVEQLVIDIRKECLLYFRSSEQVF